jgi:hypothetical protein
MSGLKMLVRIIFTIIAISMIAVSCEKVTFQPPPPPDTTKYLSFDTIIKPIFSAQGCVGCHKSGAYNPDLKTDPYRDLVVGPVSGTHAGQPYILMTDSLNPSNSEFYQWLTTDPPHIPRTTVAQRNNLLLWIKQGVRNN